MVGIPTSAAALEGREKGREEGREETIKKANQGIMNSVASFSIQSTRVEVEGTEYRYRVDQST